MELKLTDQELRKLNTKKGLLALLSKAPLSIERSLRYVDYGKKLKKLQVELIRLQTWAINNNERVIIVFEGRDAAGKGGAIRRLTERINPRHMRIVALSKPTEDQQTQWYFQRYVAQFPKAGEIVFFDRSWYNRAVVEPVNGFCTAEEYEVFMNQVNHLVKIYMSISKKEQAKRFADIKSNPLKQWKMTKLDEKAQILWEQYTEYKNAMFQKTNTNISPWKVIRANRKTEARVNVINHVLNSIPYDKDLEI